MHEDAVTGPVTVPVCGDRRDMNYSTGGAPTSEKAGLTGGEGSGCPTPSSERRGSGKEEDRNISRRIGKTKACASVRGRVPPGAPHRPLPADTPRPRRQHPPGRAGARTGVAAVRRPWGWTDAVGWGRVRPARG